MHLVVKILNTDRVYYLRFSAIAAESMIIYSAMPSNEGSDNLNIEIAIKTE